MLIKLQLILLCLVPTSLSAQISVNSGSIAGRILDDDNAPVAYVGVSLVSHLDTTTIVKGSLTTEQGNFDFQDVPYGKYLIKVSSILHRKSVTGPYEIDKEYPILQDQLITIINSRINLDEIKVVAKKQLIEFRYDKTIVNVANNPLAIGNSVLQVLQKSPGVKIYEDGKISLKGRAGTNIMIDGKMTYLSSTQLKEMLNSMDASVVDAIELISNPAASFDASGNGGVINIKLKKNKEYGMNGGITIGGGYGRNYKANSSANLSYRTKVFNVYGAYSYTNNKLLGLIDIVRVNNLDDPTFFDQNSTNIGKAKNNSFRAGIDFFVDKNNTIALQFRGYDNKWKELVTNKTTIGHEQGLADSILAGINFASNRFQNKSYGLNYRSILDTAGKEFLISIDYLDSDNHQYGEYQNTFLNLGNHPISLPTIFRNISPSKIDVWAIKADYILPIQKKSILQFGVKSSWVNTDNQFINENFSKGTWENDLSKSNTFLYNENINAAYIDFTNEIRSTSFRLGFRFEHTSSQGNSTTMSNVVNNQYLNIFPSVVISQNVKKDHGISISFNRRIDRPDYGSLNPFIYYTDPYTIIQGNPFLRPQFTSSYNLAYTYKKNWNVSLGYNLTNELINPVLLSDTSNKSLYQTTKNIGRKKVYNLNVNLPISITKQWSTSNSATIYYTDIESANTLGFDYRSNRIAFNANSTQTFTISPSTSSSISANYQSSEIYGTDLYYPNYSVDVSFSKSLIKKSLNLSLAVNDVFNTLKYDFRSNLPFQAIRAHIKPETRIIRMSLNYRFGTKKPDIKRDKSTSDLEKRIKSN